MSLYTIKIVPKNEVDKLVSFIDSHWKKGHALVKSRELLDFQHLDVTEDCYNFIVAENNETHEYDALVGFIPTSQYDEKLSAEGDYWGAIWKCREDVTNTEINNAAFYVWKRIFKLPFFHSYAAIGISDIAKQIYKASRIPVDYLRHYYIANEDCISFKIGKGLIKGTVANQNRTSSIKEISLEMIDDSMLQSVYRPRKTIQYFINRYQNHPIYNYRFIGVYNSEKIIAIFSCRKLKVGSNYILRIVDVIGDLSTVNSIYQPVQELLKKENAEYIDLMNYGLQEDLFLKMGFHLLNPDTEDTIVPNYFEPFEQRNVKIEIGYKADYDGYVAFKGDSDQDRPNEL